MEQLYSLRESFTHADEAPSPGSMPEDYYHARGWNRNGVPKPAKLEELGLTELWAS